MIPDSFWGGVAWTLLTLGYARLMLELYRCSKGWRR